MSTTHPTWVMTEWEEAQIKHGNLQPREKPVTEAQLEEAARDIAALYDPLEGKSLSELKKLEDDVEEDVLEKYREKRLAELKKKREAYRFGEVYNIGKAEYLKEVTEASQDRLWVVLLLYSESKPISQILIKAFAECAKRNGHVKFCKAVGGDVIQNFPDSRVPTILLYRDGKCKQQIAGGAIWGGLKSNGDCVEWVLHKAGVLEDTRCVVDPRENQRGGGDSGDEDDEQLNAGRKRRVGKRLDFFFNRFDGDGRKEDSDDDGGGRQSSDSSSSSG